MSMTSEDMTNEIAQALTGQQMDTGGGDAAHEMAQAAIDNPDQVTIEGETVPETGDGMKGVPLTEEEILNIVATELNNSISGDNSDSIEQNREESLSYYMGNPRGDEREGRSSIVSTDVADVVEWILPQIIKALTSKGPVISFDSIAENDEVQAELETEFTHDVFMKENPGFLNLYTFVKDALMYKNGVLKIYYDDAIDVIEEQYTGLNDNELQMLAATEGVEIVAMTQTIDQPAMEARQMQIEQGQQQAMQLQQQGEQAPDPQTQQQIGQKLQQVGQQLQMVMSQPPPMISDVEVTITRAEGKAVVVCIPLEEFRVAKYHNSLNLSESRFTAHVCLKTRSECLEEGFDPAVIDDAPADSGDDYDREFRFTEQGEDTVAGINYTEDRSQELLEVSECVIMIDLERSGVASLQKITVLGSDTPTDILDIEPVTEVPFVSSSTIIMQHKFLGLSIYDRLRQLQDQKTSLWRNIMDNLYLQNNREKEVVEKNVNIDDLLVSRPGGLKRVKVAGSIRELEVQPIGQEGYQMMDYLDKVRTGRAGVSPDTAGVQPVAGSNVGSEGVERLMTAKEELTGLMVRVIAETGLKEAYKMLRNLLVRHHDTVTQFKFKGQWADVDPTQWGDRARTTVMVGTGTGDDARKQAAITRVLDYQTVLAADPSGQQTLVDEPQIYQALDTFCTTAGLPGAEGYFLDPDSEEGKAAKKAKEEQAAQDKQKADAIQAEMTKANNMIAEGENMKGQAALQSQQAKLQVEQMKGQQAQEKQEFEAQKAAMQMELDTANSRLKAAEAGGKQEFNYTKLEVDAILERERLEQEEALKLTEMELRYNEQAATRDDANRQADIAREDTLANDAEEGEPESEANKNTNKEKKP